MRWQSGLWKSEVTGNRRAEKQCDHCISIPSNNKCKIFLANNLKGEWLNLMRN